MRLFLLLLLLTYVLSGYSQATAKKDTSLKVINDTTFIVREFQGEEKAYHAIYIEKDSKSKRFKWLMDFRFDQSDKEGLQESLKYAKEEESVKKLKRYNMQGLPKNWLPLYQYHNKFYLYGPSDWGNAGRRIICDSLLINWYMDGPYPELLESVTKKDAQTFIILFKHKEEDKESETLIIHIIDPKIKLAVWEYIHKDGSPSDYELYIPVAAAPNYDMIINYSNYMKQMEFDFDEIDFQKLLKWK